MVNDLTTSPRFPDQIRFVSPPMALWSPQMSPSTWLVNLPSMADGDLKRPSRLPLRWAAHPGRIPAGSRRSVEICTAMLGCKQVVERMLDENPNLIRPAAPTGFAHAARTAQS
jgi:hypothetical protein